MQTTRDLQERLKALGYNPGIVDGSMGPNTRAAVRAFQSAQGLHIDGVAGPRTWAALDKALTKAGAPAGTSRPAPPWVDEMVRRKGLHENRDHSELTAWLRSAGSAVNPARTPWCGDAVETAILRALSDEPVPGNPMASINWLKFGRELKTPSFGAVLVFWRGSKSGWQGHVGFYVGEDASHYHVLGGNQSDAITITKLKKGRLREGGIRWPSGFPLPTSGRVVSDGSRLIETKNEA
ncbi:peptidoglycan-binding protein [Hoeflea sp.]|uniref:NlpC/P60 family protein n=1 Tax=Hoeflea sp. TaxID=1940281 RepID=UPI001994DDAA|nr:peptidoglycan-binding protein [Hoeflea sp.]MBC7280049.1 peptidoglycan-binding protein [Hoeflea sp.]